MQQDTTSEPFAWENTFVTIAEKYITLFSKICIRIEKILWNSVLIKCGQREKVYDFYHLLI